MEYSAKSELHPASAGLVATFRAIFGSAEPRAKALGYSVLPFSWQPIHPSRLAQPATCRPDDPGGDRALTYIELDEVAA